MQTPMFLASKRTRFHCDVQVFEEKQLKGKFQLSPAQIVGTEGCWGVILMAGIVLPSMCVRTHRRSLRHVTCRTQVLRAWQRSRQLRECPGCGCPNRKQRLAALNGNTTARCSFDIMSFIDCRCCCTGVPSPSTTSSASQSPTSFLPSTARSSTRPAPSSSGALTCSFTTRLTRAFCCRLHSCNAILTCPLPSSPSPPNQ